MNHIKNLKKELEQKFQKDFKIKKIFNADVLEIKKEELLGLLQYLKQNQAFDFLMCVTGVHYPEQEKEFEVCYELFSSSKAQRLRLKIPVTEEEQIPTAQFIYPTADWFEREIYDMYGLKFKDHPNMKRILTHHQFKGHPLRKDYPADLQQHLSEALEFSMDNEPDGNPPDFKGKDLIPLNIGPSHPGHTRHLENYGSYGR